MNENQITYLRVEDIMPHVNNPRKELGDLTELAESIGQNGIMQNLTVVPQESGYTVIIGHRRLAAAKLAGLQEVPCIIADMDEKRQLATMLLENMQRNDLTIQEQAEGFQMMLDMGETEGDIAKKTGFSRSTVRKRLFIASHDKEKSKNAFERGASLEDYMKLNQIESEEKRNEVLDALGTYNFDHKLQTAILEELHDRVVPKIIKQIQTFAKPTDRQGWELKGYQRCQWYSYEDCDKGDAVSVKVPKRWKEDEYLYHETLRGVEIYKREKGFKIEKKMSELPPEEQEERREKRRKYKALKEAGEVTYKLRLDFIKSLSQKSALNPDQSKALSEFAFAVLCLGEQLNFSEYFTLENIQTEGAWGWSYHQKKDVIKKANVPDVRLLLGSLYCTLRDSEENTYFCGSESPAEKRGYHKRNEKLDAIYDCICAFGYAMSDEERALRDGTHELFLKDA